MTTKLQGMMMSVDSRLLTLDSSQLTCLSMTLLCVLSPVKWTADVSKKESRLAKKPYGPRFSKKLYIN